MASLNESGKERRTGTRDMVEKWLAGRQKMLVLFSQLGGLDLFDADRPVEKVLKEFCQEMVDYIAFGHFEVYDRITRGGERRAKVIRIAEALYPRVAAATEVAIAFNDKYDASNHDLSMDELTADLSKLGEELATRIEMEDKLVVALTGS